MSNAAALVAQLAAAGTPPELLAAVAQELFTAEAERRILSDRRENERARKARSRDSTGQDVTACDVPGAVSKERHSNLSSSEPRGSSESDKPRARKADKFPCPEGVDPQHWADFLANRRTKRLTNTPTAHRGILRELAKFADDEWPPGRIVEFAAARGWAGIFDPRTRQDNGRQRTNGMGGHQPSDGLSATTRAALRVFGPTGAGDEPRVPQ